MILRAEQRVQALDDNVFDVIFSLVDLGIDWRQSWCVVRFKFNAACSNWRDNATARGFRSAPFRILRKTIDISFRDIIKNSSPFGMVVRGRV